MANPRLTVMCLHMGGGGGARKTLGLVAQYADACNIYGGREAARHKLDVLRSHCETVGRNYDEIEKTTLISIDATTTHGELLDKLRIGAPLSCSPGLARPAASRSRCSAASQAAVRRSISTTRKASSSACWVLSRGSHAVS
jgi:alkanesulfonate monooxygenase SsuD/methylene tetrahydromethanopterin reductase-like flavin-dependent oxidoreductase (luciferase family)